MYVLYLFNDVHFPVPHLGLEEESINLYTEQNGSNFCSCRQFSPIYIHSYFLGFLITIPNLLIIHNILHLFPLFRKITT